MTHNFRPAAAVTALGLAGLTGLGLLTPESAAAAPAPHDGLTNHSPSKAQTERAERDAAGRGGDAERRDPIVIPSPSSGSERAERDAAGRAGDAERRDPIVIPTPSSGDAAAWQLALSAALGAAVTGGVVLAARQVSHHRHAVAS